MKLTLPKDLRGFQCRELTWFELNDFDADLVFPALFGLIVTGGTPFRSNKLTRTVQRDGASVTEPIQPDDLIEALSRHPEMVGFDNERGRSLLREWVHSSIAKIGTRTVKRRGETVQYIQPIHLATYTAGLPATGAQRRDVHLALFKALSERIRQYDTTAPLRTLKQLFTETLGGGVTYGSGQDNHRPRYDGKTELDLTTLVTLRYLEQFEPAVPLAGVPLRDAENRLNVPFLLPRSMDLLAEELIGYLAGYRGRIPGSAVSHGLVAQANLGLFRYLLQTIATVGHLFDGASADEATITPASLEIYVDATGQKGGPSDRLARETTNRDLASIGRFFEQVLMLRLIDQAALEVWSPDDVSPIERFRRAASEYRYADEIRAYARVRIGEVRNLNTDEEGAGLDDAQFDALVGHLDGPIEKLATLLTLRGSNTGVTNFVKWFRSTGGLTKSYGILSGNLLGRKNWRYYLSDELLSVLVQQAFVYRETENPLAEQQLQPKIRLAEFLALLEERWGILIDRPPSDQDSPKTRAAASSNLDALKDRLRAMGYFQALSDDFSAQYLRNPFFEEQL